MAKPLRIGMIGYGFMGRAHSNGYNRVKNFFDLEYEPVLQAVAARDTEKAQAFATKWGISVLKMIGENLSPPMILMQLIFVRQTIFMPILRSKLPSTEKQFCVKSLCQ